MRSRILHLVAALVVGLGVGALVYRFAILGVRWNGSLRVILPGVAAGLIGAGFTLHAVETKGERPRTSTRIALAIVGISIAMGVLYLCVPSLERMPLERRQLPGFSIDLPTDTPTTERIEYALGQIEFTNVGDARSTVGISWAREQSETTLEVALAAVAKLGKVHATPTPVSFPGPEGMSARTLGIGFDTETPMRMTQLTCGKRTLFIMSFGSAGIESVHRRMLKSVVCTPDAAFENAENAVRVVLEMPGWTTVEKSSSVLTLSDGESLLVMFEGHPRNWTMVELVAALPVFLHDIGVAVAKPALIDRIPFEMMVAGAPAVGWLRNVRCSTHGVMLVAIADTEEQAEAIYSASSNARCPRDGEAPSEWPLSTSE
jgi:hypothetical protein